MSEKRNIYESMAAVMEDCGAVAKDEKNQKHGYKYRGIDAVMNALNPALRKHKVFVIPEVLEQTREERESKNQGLLIYSITKVKYTFYAEDGSSISAVVIGEGMDSGDKSMNKAMSAAFKYACFQAFCIPTEEMKDSEQDSPEPAPRRAKEKPEPKTEKERAEEVYPDRAIMIEKIKHASKPTALNKWLSAQDIHSVEEATDVAIMALYRYYEERGIE
ncbi:MAG: ERF family protein [Methanomicrobium sp.]|nr:ERF family protein [Methanomicrobium sp.]